MSLPPNEPRRKLHTRTIVMEGFERADGLFDIEARLSDTKAYDVDHPQRGYMRSGTFWHDMLLRLTVDEQYNVRDIHVSTEAAPYADCATVAPAYQALIGANLARGFRKAVNEAVGAAKGCTHLRELLMPVATTAFQTIMGRAAGFPPPEEQDPNGPEPIFLGSCKAWAPDSPQMKRYFPMFYRKKEKAEQT